MQDLEVVECEQELRGGEHQEVGAVGVLRLGPGLHEAVDEILPAQGLADIERVGGQQHLVGIAEEDAVARRLALLEPEHRGAVVQRLVLAPHVAQDLAAVALAVGQHALGALAVLQAHGGHVAADPAGLDRLQPEVPVLEAELHALVEAHAAAEHVGAHQAAGFAVVLEQVLQHRVRAAGADIELGAEHVDVGIGPAGERVAVERVPGTLQRLRVEPVVGVQQVDRLDARPGRERKVDAAIARRAQPAIGLAKIDDAVGMGAGVLERGLVGIVERAAVVDDDDFEIELGLLHQGGTHRLVEQDRMLEHRQHHRDQRSGASGTGAQGRRGVAGGLRQCRGPILHDASPLSRARSSRTSTGPRRRNRPWPAEAAWRCEDRRWRRSAPRARGSGCPASPAAGTAIP